MANEENLKKGEKTRFNGETAAENGRRSAISRARKKAEKKTIQSILINFLNSPCDDMEQFEKLAQKLGIETKKSKKELFAIVCILNAMKKGNLDDIEKLMNLLGETESAEAYNVMKDDPLTASIKEEFKDGLF